MESLLKMRKPQLYVALYALDGALREPGPDGSQKYWWTFLIAPENAPRDQECIRYRIKKLRGWEKGETEMIEWQNDRCMVPGTPHDDIVARVLVAAIEDARATEDNILHDWPEKTARLKASGAVRTSRDWVERVLDGLRGVSHHSLSGSTGYLASMLTDWQTIEGCCTSFAQKAAVVGSASLDTVPTFDLRKNREVT